MRFWNDDESNKFMEKCGNDIANMYFELYDVTGRSEEAAILTVGAVIYIAAYMISEAIEQEG